MEAAFGAGPPYTAGVEEEFQLVDPASPGAAPHRIAAPIMPQAARVRGWKQRSAPGRRTPSASRKSSSWWTPPPAPRRPPSQPWGRRAPGVPARGGAERQRRAPAREAAGEGGDGAALVTSELSRSCVEMVSPVFESVSDLARELPALRRRGAEIAQGAGVEIVAAGTHPFSEPTEQPLAEGAHNRRLEDEMGWVARTQAIYGLHVHAAAPAGGGGRA